MEQTHAFGDRYELLGEVARGGMGVVYQVRDLDLDRILALKRLEARDQHLSLDAGVDLYARFLEEVQVTAKLDHPAIIPVHDLGFDEEGVPFYTMRFIEGISLYDLLEKPEAHPEWTKRRKIEVLVRICQTLAFAHDKGVIHRDLKPSNIMMGSLGEVYIMDWGLARAISSAKQTGSETKEHEVGRIRSARTELNATVTLDSPLHTMEGAVIGTPAYMPPEQAEGKQADINEYSDIYSLGAILYHMLTGHPPYVIPGVKTSGPKVIEEIKRGSPSELDGEGELQSIAKKAMNRDPALRYDSAVAMATDLQAYLEHRVVQAHHTGLLDSWAKWIRRNKALAALITTVILGLMAIGTILFSFNRSLSESLANEIEANANHQQAVADLHTGAGLVESDSTIASLWFTGAAALEKDDPEKARVHLIRARNWRSVSHIPMRMMKSELSLSGGGIRIKRIKFHPTLPFLIIEKHNEAEIWNYMDEEKPHAVPGTFAAAAWDETTGRLAVVSKKSQLTVYSLPDFEEEFTIDSHPLKPTAVAFHPEMNSIAIAGKKIRVIDLDTEKFNDTPPGVAMSQTASGLQFSGDGSLLVAAEPTKALALKLSDQGLFKKMTLAHQEWLPDVYTFFPPTFIGPNRLLTQSSPAENFTTASQDTDFRINHWDLDTGALLHSVRISEPLVDCPPDSELGGYSRNSRFDLHSGERTWFTSGLTGIKAITPDGSKIVSAGYFGTFIEPENGQVIQEFGRAFADMLDMAAISFSPNELLIATADLAGRIRIWNAWVPPNFLRIEGPQFTNPEIDVTPDGSHFLMGGSVKITTSTAGQVYRSDDGQPVGKEIKPEGHLVGAAFASSPGEALLLIAGKSETRSPNQFKEGAAQLWNWESGTATSAKLQLPSEPRTATLLPNTHGYAVYCARGEVGIISSDCTRFTQLFQAAAPTEGKLNGYSSSGFYPLEGDRLLFDLEGHEFRIFDLESKKMIQTLPRLAFQASYPPTSVAGNLLATREGEFGKMNVAIFDLKKNQLRKTSLYLKEPTTTSFSADHQQLLIGGGSREARVADIADDRWLGPAYTHESRVTTSALIPDSTVAFTQDQNQNDAFWDYRTGKLISPPVEEQRFIGKSQALIAGQNQNRLILSGSNGVQLFDLDSIAAKDFLPVEDELLLAEINSNHRIDHGNLFKLTHQEWLKRWKKFRTKYPHWHDHLLIPGERELKWYNQNQSLPRHRNL